MNAPEQIESRFGWDWRGAVYRAGAPMEPSRLAAVLVDLAYANRSPVIQASERTLRYATSLHGRSFERARKWLTDRGFVEQVEKGRGHVASQLRIVMPHGVSAEGRTIASPAQARAKPAPSSPATTPADTPVAMPAASPAPVPAPERATPKPESKISPAKPAVDADGQRPSQASEQREVPSDVRAWMRDLWPDGLLKDMRGETE